MAQEVEMSLSGNGLENVAYERFACLAAAKTSTKETDYYGLDMCIEPSTAFNKAGTFSRVNNLVVKFNKLIQKKGMLVKESNTPKEIYSDSWQNKVQQTGLPPERRSSVGNFLLPSARISKKKSKAISQHSSSQHNRSYSEPNLIKVHYKRPSLSASTHDSGIYVENNGKPYDDQLNSETWSDANDFLEVPNSYMSISLSSLISPCDSMEEISTYIYQPFLNGHQTQYLPRSCSFDSAIFFDDTNSFPSSPNYANHSFSDKSLCKIPSETRSINNRNPMYHPFYDSSNHNIYTNGDLKLDLESRQQIVSDCDKNISAKLGVTTPTVVISDHTGATHVALATNGNSVYDEAESFISDPFDYVDSSRKISNCSTLSSISTADIASLGVADNLHVGREWRKRDSDCSSCSFFTTASEDEAEDEVKPAASPLKKNSNWRKVRNVVQWTPFIQTYKRHKYPWVQLAGHQGNFKAGYTQGTILKKLCPAEENAFEALKKDELKPCVPEYMGVVEGNDNEKYLQLQDLLSNFSNPCVMDIKMGVRTYLEEELAKARHKPKLRKDMYEKMVQIDENAPSEAEHRAKAVTKPRYMVWRETISSTATLGFRIEGVRRSDGTSSKDFKTTKTREQVLHAIDGFLRGYDDILAKYVQRLNSIKTTLRNSGFFRSHELIGSSLLFVHDNEKCGVWLIDFAKTVPLPESVNISHSIPWVEGTHEDGYLIGLNNLTELVESLQQPGKIDSTSGLVNNVLGTSAGAPVAEGASGRSFTSKATVELQFNNATQPAQKVSAKVISSTKSNLIEENGIANS